MRREEEVWKRLMGMDVEGEEKWKTETEVGGQCKHGLDGEGTLEGGDA